MLRFLTCFDGLTHHAQVEPTLESNSLNIRARCRAGRTNRRQFPIDPVNSPAVRHEASLTLMHEKGDFQENITFGGGCSSEYLVLFHFNNVGSVKFERDSLFEGAETRCPSSDLNRSWARGERLGRPLKAFAGALRQHAPKICFVSTAVLSKIV